MHLSASSARVIDTYAKPLPRPVSLSRGMSTSATTPCLLKRSRMSRSEVLLSKFFTKIGGPSAPKGTATGISPAFASLLPERRASAFPEPEGASAEFAAALAVLSFEAFFSDSFWLFLLRDRRPNSFFRSASRASSGSPLSLVSSAGSEVRPAPKRPSRLGNAGKAAAASMLPAPSSESFPDPARSDGGNSIRSVLVQEPPVLLVVRTPSAFSCFSTSSSASCREGPGVCEKRSSISAMILEAFSLVSLSIKKEVAGDIRCLARNASSSGSP
mmetsp:Transcript_25048/g.42755  ORF Transcript_25048/g.42755 Transcript_25048/m.42755 type:complete len:272 (+) Transcript_25048:1308-2123(+)